MKNFEKLWHLNIRLNEEYNEKIGNRIYNWCGIPPDKQLHFLTGFVLCFVLLWPIGKELSLFVVTLAGLSKEIFDKISKMGCSDVNDFIATFSGGFICYVIANLIEIIKRHI